MSYWPFEKTPREAFFEERALAVEAAMSALDAAAHGQLAGLSGAALAERLDELQVDAPEILKDANLTGHGPLDFMAACLHESVDLYSLVCDGARPKSGGFENIKPERDVSLVIRDELVEDAQDLGLASIVARLHYRAGVDRFPYAKALFRYLFVEVPDMTREEAPRKLSLTLMRGSGDRHLDQSLLCDIEPGSFAQVPSPRSMRSRYMAHSLWKADYLKQLDIFAQLLAGDDGGERPALVVDKLLTRLVYDPVMNWLFTDRVTVDELWLKYQPIVYTILEHQGFEPRYLPVYARHIWMTALSVDPAALLHADCTLNDLLPVSDEAHGSFADKPTPLFLQGPVGAFWSYNTTYATNHLQGLEEVIGEVGLNQIFASHLVSSEAINTLIEKAGFGDSGSEAMTFLGSAAMEDVANNPFQSSDGLNRLFQLVFVTEADRSQEMIQKLFLNRIKTVIQQKRYLTSNLYLDVTGFASKFDHSQQLLRACLAIDDLKGPQAGNVADMLVDVFRIEAKTLQGVTGIPNVIRDKVFSADLGL